MVQTSPPRKRQTTTAVRIRGIAAQASPRRGPALPHRLWRAATSSVPGAYPGGQHNATGQTAEVDWGRRCHGHIAHVDDDRAAPEMRKIGPETRMIREVVERQAAIASGDEPAPTGAAHDPAREAC